MFKALVIALSFIASVVYAQPERPDRIDIRYTYVFKNEIYNLAAIQELHNAMYVIEDLHFNNSYLKVAYDLFKPFDSNQIDVVIYISNYADIHTGLLGSKEINKVSLISQDSDSGSILFKSGGPIILFLNWDHLAYTHSNGEKILRPDLHSRLVSALSHELYGHIVRWKYFSRGPLLKPLQEEAIAAQEGLRFLDGLIQSRGPRLVKTRFTDYLAARTRAIDRLEKVLSQSQQNGSEGLSCGTRPLK